MFRGTCAEPSCASWPPPVCLNDKSESGCEVGDKCLFTQTEADSQPSKKSKTSGGIGSVALLKESTYLGCVFQDTEPPKFNAIFAEEHKNLWDQIAPSASQKGTLHTVNFQERKGPSQGVVQICEPQERSLCAPKFEGRTQEEILQQERCAR